MELLKKLKWIFVLLLVIAGLVSVRMAGDNGFKGDARDAVATIAAGDFLVSVNEFNQNKDEYQVVTLGKAGGAQSENAIQISFEKLADETTLQQIKSSGKKILLTGTDMAQTVKAWIILNQMQVKNLFILSEKENIETLKYNFIPETINPADSVE